MMLAEIGTGGGVGLMPGHAAKLPHAGCALVRISAPVIESELLLVMPRTEGVRKELDSLIALLVERAGSI